MSELILSFPEIEIPVENKHPIQAMLYKLTDDVFKWHSEGYKGVKYIRPYSFSDFIGHARFNKQKQTLKFVTPSSLVIRSFEDKWIEALYQKINKSKSVQINSKTIPIENITMGSKSVKGRRLMARTLSPICLAKERDSQDKIKMMEVNEQWADRILYRLSQEYKLLTGEYIDPVGKFGYLKEPKKRVYKYQGGYVTAYHGDILLEADNRLLQIAINKGLGSCQSKGFGLIEEYRECDKKWTLPPSFLS